MKRIWILFILSVFAMVNVALADQIVITTGSKKGTYFKVGNRLRQFLPNSRVIPSKGSIENLERLLRGDAQVAVAVQMDAYASFIKKHPEAVNELEILGPIYKECAFLATRCDGKVTDEDDLQKKRKEPVTIAVGKRGSGTQITWEYMMSLEPNYKNANVAFLGGSRALGKLATKQLDAVMWVEKPRLDGKVSTVMNNKDLCLSGFHDWDLNDKLPETGKPVYTFEEVEVKKGIFNDKEFKTACMDAVIVARSDLDEDILDTIADALLKYKNTLVK